MQTSSVICVVDDDEGVRESIETFFRSAGIRVRTYEAAEALLASAELPSMDFLITDLHMPPGMSGLDLQRELRRLGRNVPVILMTAYATPEARAAADALGVAAFVTKPTDPEALLDQVTTLLAG